MQISLKLEVMKVVTLEFSLSSADKEKKENDSKDTTEPKPSTATDSKQ